MANGLYMRTNGASLRSVSSVDLYSIAISYMFEQIKRTEDEYEVEQKFRRHIADQVFEQESGMPAISQYGFRPADELE